jgi:hypothetical protein
LLKNRLSNNAGGVKHFLGRTGPCISHTKEKTGLREVALTAVTCAFVSAMTHDGRTLRILTLIDEYTREVFGVAGGTALGEFAGDRHAGGWDAGAGDSGAHPFG